MELDLDDIDAGEFTAPDEVETQDQAQATVPLATEAQFKFIRSLLADRELEPHHLKAVEVFRQLAVESKLDRAQASLLIDMLKRCPRKEVPEVHLEPGVYTDADNFVRVYQGQSGRMLAKTIIMLDDGVEYVYAGLASRIVTDNYRRMTLDEIGSLGRAFNHCALCGRRLDDPESVDRGVGPICATKYDN